MSLNTSGHDARHAGRGSRGGAAGAGGTPDYTDLLGQIGVPALVVVGRDDRFTPIPQAEFMQQRIPGADLVVIDGAAHMPNLERPEEFNAVLRGFLSRVSPARP